MRILLLVCAVAVGCGESEPEDPAEPNVPCAGAWPDVMGGGGTYAVTQCDRGCAVQQPTVVGPSSCSCEAMSFVKFEINGEERIGCCNWSPQVDNAGIPYAYLSLKDCN